MKATDIKKKAEDMGICCGKMKKDEIIHQIQVREGNTPCYGKSGGSCPYNDCCFRKDCLKIK